MGEIIKKYGMGWRRDYPDFRDYTIESEQISLRHKRLGQKDTVKAILKKTGVVEHAKVSLPPSVNLVEWCSPIEDQGMIGSCTAHAGVGMLEYFERRAFGRHIDASRLFLYKVTRNLLNWQGDTGAYLRTTMSSLVLFGIPPEEYWPYVIADFEKEPTAFCYAFAQNYQAIKYYRLDPLGTSKDTLLNRIKTNLAAGLPSMFGFTVYNSISQAETTGKIPYPTSNDDVAGGHAVITVGYDDTIKIKNNNVGGGETTGALLIRNSWGTGWGDSGYGWLPYDYVVKDLAVDWWSLIKSEWVDTGKFKL